MPTFNSCQFHHCQFPEQWAPKAVEEANAAEPPKDQEDHSTADKKEKTKAKEESEQKNESKPDSKSKEGVVPPTGTRQALEDPERVPEEGVVSPMEAKQVIKDEGFQNRKTR